VGLVGVGVLNHALPLSFTVMWLTMAQIHILRLFLLQFL